jgi:hypothetical protein
LIINHLSIKTHENTGNKPAKPISSHSFLATATEMINKPNMNHKPQHPNTANPENLKLAGSKSLKLGCLDKFSFFA